MFALLHNVLVTVTFQEMFAKTPAGDLQSSLNPWYRRYLSTEGHFQCIVAQWIVNTVCCSVRK